MSDRKWNEQNRNSERCRYHGSSAQSWQGNGNRGTSNPNIAFINHEDAEQEVAEIDRTDLGDSKAVQTHNGDEMNAIKF